MSSPEARLVYCEGKLLHYVQTLQIFQDSKTFVDMPMREDPKFILKEFSRLLDSCDNSPTHKHVQGFVEEYFNELGQELETAEPKDWKENPNILSRIKCKEMNEWASELNGLWKFLCRKIKEEVKSSMNRTSLIYVPNDFIIPGDRFREIYYWDTYWIVKGLLLCEMTETVKGMLENFLHILNKYGLVPNGGRIYYLTRSQPPLLIPMIDSYFEVTKDVDFLQENFQLLEKEYNFWITQRSVSINTSGKSYHLAHYKANSKCPRPEGYREDFNLTSKLNNEKAEIMYQNIASSCESGWDFSTRWFTDYQNMDTICTQEIVPVDLNSILAWNEKLLAKFSKILGNDEKSKQYMNRYGVRCEAIHSLMWNEKRGCWFDLHLNDSFQQRQQFYSSNFWPLFVEIYPEEIKENVVQKVVEYIQNMKLEEYPGGVPTSITTHTSQQWDFPNVWPPCVQILIEGLRKSEITAATNLAKRLATTWLNSNYQAWQQLHKMLEKYDCRHSGCAGGGGEYGIQTGFGWTNGVVLMLIDQYPDISINT